MAKPESGFKLELVGLDQLALFVALIRGLGDEGKFAEIITQVQDVTSRLQRSAAEIDAVDPH